MGSNLSSKVDCNDIRLYRKYCKSRRRPAIKIDKSQIGIPTDFRHTYHVGNSATPKFIDLLDNSSGTMNQPKAVINNTEALTDSDFLATMAQITDALKMHPPLPSNKPSHNEDNSSISDNYLPLKQFSEKEKHSIMYMSKSTSQLAVNQQQGKGYHDFSSGLQSRIDAQIVQLARARSKQKRSPVKNNNENNDFMLCDRPAIMI